MPIEKNKIIMLTLDDLVERTGIGRQSWRKYIREGQLKASKVGKSFLIYPGSFHQFIKSKEIKVEKKK